MRLERALSRNEGLPGRPWYRHHVYAPGFYTGYGVKTLPGVREAIEQRKWAEANAQVVILAGVLNRYAEMLDGERGEGARHFFGSMYTTSPLRDMPKSSRAMRSMA